MSLALEPRLAPVRSTPLPFHRPEVTEEECAAVVRTLRSGWLTTGQECAQFERELAHYLGVSEVLALSSCTAGLHLGLLAAGVGPGDVVVTTPFTFCASVNVIEHLGARPHLVDVNPLDGCLDPGALDAIPRALAVRAILPVHYAGNPCDLGAIRSWAQARGAALLSDAAHGVETRWEGESVAQASDLAAYSFYATKNLTTGEGGALALHNPEWAERVTRLRLHGMSRDALRRYEPGQKATYDVAEPGYKANLTDPAAALGRLQLAALESRWERRCALVLRYFELLKPLFEAEIGRLLIPSPPDAPNAPTRSAYHLCPFVLNPERTDLDRDAIALAMSQLGIGTSVHFTPVHEFSYYARKYGFAPGDYPVAHALGANEISLPLHPWLSDADVADVCEALRRACAAVGR